MACGELHQLIRQTVNYNKLKAKVWQSHLQPCLPRKIIFHDFNTWSQYLLKVIWFVQVHLLQVKWMLLYAVKFLDVVYSLPERTMRQI